MKATIALLLLAAALVPLKACPEIHARHGWFSTKGSLTSCTFLMNSAPINKTQLADMRAYGMLRVSCEDCVFSVFSEFSGCDSCVMCAHNQGIEECRSMAIPTLIIVSLVISVLLMVLLALFLVDYYFDVTGWCVKPLHDLREKRKANKDLKRMMRLERILEKKGPKQPYFSPYPEQLYPNLPTAPLNEEPRTPSQPIPKANIGGAVTVATLIALQQLNGSMACDSTFFMSSIGTVYLDQTLQRVSTGLSYMHVGSTLCFKHPDGTQEELTMAAMNLVETYGAIYKTCDFSLEFKSTSRCLGSGMCWGGSACRDGVRLQEVGPKAYTVPESQTSCRLVPNLSDSACTHRQLCVWYYWDIMVNEDKCDLIFEKLSEDTIVRFTHKDVKGNIIPFSLSTSSPSLESPIQLHLGYVRPEYISTFQNVRKHFDLFMGTKAEGINRANPGQLGDLQVPLIKTESGKNWSYPIHAISCHPDGSSITCKTPRTGYVATIDEDSKNVLTMVEGENPLSLTRVRSVKGYTQVMLRTKEIESQVIESARCGFDLVSTYGCISCPEMPTVYLKPTGIEKTGVIPFTSNCSFFLPEVGCSEHVQALQLLERADVCKLTFKSTNQSLIVKFDYKFLGQIFERGVVSYHAEESISSALKLSMQSPEFFASLRYTALAGGTVALLSTLAKLGLRYASYKRAKVEVDDLMK